MDLLQIRRHKQAAVTVLMSSVERFIVAKDQEKVQRQLDKLHGAFDLFETAHLEVLASLNADPDGQSKGSLKFVDIERLYTLSRVFSPIRERADNLSLMKKTLFLHSFYEITKY